MSQTYLEILRAQWSTITASCTRPAKVLMKLTYPVDVSTYAGRFCVTIETPFEAHRAQLSSPMVRNEVQNALQGYFSAPVIIDVRTPARVVKGRSGGSGGVPTRITPGRVRGGRRGPIQAIPTSYGGFHMRSKLEADSAALFDRAELEWDYEVEGYNMGGTLYLPDFVLYAAHVIIEVKGVFDANAERKATKLAQAAHDNGDKFRVLILQRLRPQKVNGLLQRYVAATLASADGSFYECGMILARCPVCEQAQWKAPGARACLDCGRESEPNIYQPIK